MVCRCCYPKSGPCVYQAKLLLSGHLLSLQTLLSAIMNMEPGAWLMSTSTFWVFCQSIESWSHLWNKNVLQLGEVGCSYGSTFSLCLWLNHNYIWTWVYYLQDNYWILIHYLGLPWQRTTGWESETTGMYFFTVLKAVRQSPQGQQASPKASPWLSWVSNCLCPSAFLYRYYSFCIRVTHDSSQLNHLLTNPDLSTVTFWAMGERGPQLESQFMWQTSIFQRLGGGGFMSNAADHEELSGILSTWRKDSSV